MKPKYYHSFKISLSTLSKRLTSTNLKAKAIIYSIPKSLTVNKNTIVRYQQRQPPRTTSQTIQHCENLKTVAPYKTEILEKSFVITIEPNSESTQSNPSNTPQGKRQKYHPARDNFSAFGFLKPEENFVEINVLEPFAFAFSVCV